MATGAIEDGGAEGQALTVGNLVYGVYRLIYTVKITIIINLDVSHF